MIRSLKRFIQNTDSFTNETQLQRMRSSVAVITVNVALHLNRFLNKIVTRLQCINIFGTEMYQLSEQHAIRSRYQCRSSSFGSAETCLHPRPLPSRSPQTWMTSTTKRSPDTARKYNRLTATMPYTTTRTQGAVVSTFNYIIALGNVNVMLGFPNAGCFAKCQLLQEYFALLCRI